MSELAFNRNGEGFDVPPTVMEWRVLRMRPRGAPELAYGRDGRPLTVPVDADIDELREAVGTPGKYRLDPVDGDGKLVDGVPAAYVQVIAPQVDTPATPATRTPADETESVLREAIRTNADLARTVIDRFPAMMESAARLIEAADGAGIPRRVPRLIEVDEDGEPDEWAEGTPAPAAAPTVGAFDINALVAQVVPVIVMSIMNGKFDLSRVGELFDWRKAAAAGESAKKATAARTDKVRSESAAVKSRPPAATTWAVPAKGEDEAIPPLDPSAMAHFIAIQQALTPKEAALAREVAKSFSPAELRAWFAELSKLSVPDAVAAIRRHLGHTTDDGGAS